MIVVNEAQSVNLFHTPVFSEDTEQYLYNAPVSFILDILPNIT